MSGKKGPQDGQVRVDDKGDVEIFRRGDWRKMMCKVGGGHNYPWCCDQCPMFSIEDDGSEDIWAKFYCSPSLPVGLLLWKESTRKKR